MTTPAVLPESDADIVDRLVQFLVQLDPALATRRAEIETDLRAEFGGDRWYVRAATETQRQARVRQVLQLFNGRNASEVARQLRIGRATVYRIIKQPGAALSPAPLQQIRAASKPRAAAKTEAAAPALSHALPTAETA